MTNRSQRVEVEVVERRERVTKARKEMGALMEFIKRGEGSQYVGQNLRELEDYVRAENALIERLERTGGAPTDLPSVDQIAGVAFDLEKRIAQDVDSGRAMLGRLLKGGTLSIGPGEDGKHYVLSGLSSEVLFPVLATPENDKPSEQLEGRRTDLVAGAGFARSTTCNPSRSRSDSSSNTTLDAVDFAFLDYLIEMAFKTVFRPSSSALVGESKVKRLRPRRAKR